MNDLPATPPVSPEHIWSRTAGALPIWHRLGDLHLVIVGVGRSGSQLARSLVRLGAGQVWGHMTLVDPDVMEIHNLGEMDAVGPDAVGRFKVVAVQESLQRQAAWCGLNGDVPLRIMPVSESVSSLRSLDAFKDADFVFVCVDNPIARIAATFLAACYLRPMIDIGTGVTHEATRRTLGASVRLVFGNCLLCSLGGIPGLRAACRHILDQGIVLPRRTNEDDWRQERSGSLESLNGLAVHLAMRLFEDVLDERIRSAVWLQLDFGDSGEPTLLRNEPIQSTGCVLCNQYAGKGDWAVERFRDFVSELHHRGQQ